MSLAVDWYFLGELFKEVGLAPKQNKVYSMLLTGGFLPESIYNALAIYNHDYSVITTFEDWKHLVEVCKANTPNNYTVWKPNHNQWGVDIVNFTLKFAENKPFLIDIIKEVSKKKNNYLGIFHIHHLSSAVQSHINGISEISEDEDLEVLKIGLKFNFFNQNHLKKIKQKIRKQVLLDFARDKEIVHQLNFIIPMIDIESKEVWDSIFEQKKVYEPQFIKYARKMPFFVEIIKDCFEDIIKAEEVTKDQAITAYSYLTNILNDKKAPVHSLTFEVLKKIHPKITVWQNKHILSLFKNNKKALNSPEFEDYIKHLITEKTRAGVLKPLVSILPQKQLPWLLSSEFKTVKSAVKKKLKA